MDAGPPPRLWSRRAQLGAMALLLPGLAGGVRAGTTGRSLSIRGSTATLEIAPVLLAARDYYPSAVVRNGGIGHIVGAEPDDGHGPADLATHAETQALRYSVARPDLRIILTITEGRYRIVARRSAGIARVEDLAGKRVATLAITSAGYFLAKMLESADGRFGDVQAVRVPAERMEEALAAHEVDAVAIWEPHAGNALRRLGEDGIAFSGDAVYRERFNLNTTALALADPARRAAIVGFVRALFAARDAMARDPATAQRLVAVTAGFKLEEVRAAWPTLSFPMALGPDLIDVLVDEERWLAARNGRSARSRAELSSLIDPSIHREATRNQRSF